MLVSIPSQVAGAHLNEFPCTPFTYLLTHVRFSPTEAFAFVPDPLTSILPRNCSRASVCYAREDNIEAEIDHDNIEADFMVFTNRLPANLRGVRPIIVLAV